MSYHRLAALLLLAPSTLVSQSLGRQIEAVRDGTVRFSYAARPGLCGDGRETVRSGA